VSTRERPLRYFSAAALLDDIRDTRLIAAAKKKMTRSVADDIRKWQRIVAERNIEVQ
jgi:hypothetical protein